MKKSYLTLVVILMTTILYAQNKKEQIALLTDKVDSLNAVILKELITNDSIGQVLNTDINAKKEEIQTLNISLIENQKILALKNSEILLLQDKMKLALDSVSVLVQMLESKKDSISSISIAEFRQVNRNNIHEYDVESFMGVFKGLETRFYVEANYITNSDGLAEEAYFEMLLDNKVVLRGFVQSACGDGYTYSINYYTLDGFLYRTKFADGVVEYSSHWEIIIYSGTDAFFEYGGTSAYFDNRPSETDKSSIINNLKSIPKTFKITKTKPDIMDCVYIDGFAFE
jgi:sporulation protein YlmC with PRC-barrel domain